jgi:hypothetical protein
MARTPSSAKNRRGNGDEVLVRRHEITPARDRIERFDGALPKAAGHRHGADVGLAKLGKDLAGEMPALKAVDQHELLLLLVPTLTGAGQAWLE